MTNPDPNSLPAEETSTPYAESDLQRFAARREEMGLTLADVFSKTRISVKNLAALESGDYATLPPPVYTKAFIRQYADLLEIDPRPLLAKYDAVLKSQEDPRPARKSEDAEKPPRGIQLRKFLWLSVVVLFVVVALVFYLYNPDEKQPAPLDQQSASPATQTETPTPPVDVAPTPAEPPPPATLAGTIPPVPAAPQAPPAAPPAVTPPVSPKPLTPPVPAANAPASVTPGSQKLILKAKETTWVGILIDNQEGQQVLLQPGDVVTYTGNQFRMDIGNAGGVDVMLQGKTMPPLGKSGQVVHVTLP